MMARVARELAGERRAQATVEMAIAAPVMLVVALIVYNVMVFACAVARFDRVAPDIVVAHGVAPAGDASGEGTQVDAVGVVERNLREAMEGYDVTVEVSVTEGSQVRDVGTARSSAGGDRSRVRAARGGKSGGGAMLSMTGALKTYRCVLRYEPWPQGFSIAGVSLGAPLELVHERPVTIDSWRPGVLV